ncbi:RNA-binding protein NOB1 [Harpegnathos saltator]|uniref:RNA-binding protein NOB1 n=1 Tax=Harpegnathos saltator TaxID=610380 RepID=E2BKQ7_HARSA|nr:RNA-binding protein NOB1 [Harpegnathos saltator]
MDKKNKIQYLIVDTSAFIKNASLQDIGINIFTEQAVINEITNKRQLRRLVVLPYDLEVQEAFTENIKFVTEFAKKTGDYTSLSATDIKIIALTYQLEKEKIGTDHLKNIPTTRIVKSTAERDKENEDNLKPPVGFYMPKKKEKTELNADKTETSSQNIEETNIKENINIQVIEDSAANNIINDTKNQDQSLYICDVYNASLNKSDYETSEPEEWETKNLSEKFAKLTCDPTDFKVEGEDENKDLVNDILVPVGTTKSKDRQGNLADIKKQMDSAILEEKAATVACLTMDFAMQNVLMQIGLNVATLDGRMIKQMQTFIFRCYACFKTTSIMTKVFCPHCGNKTLKKVGVTLDENGKQQLHINFRKPLSAKGKKFSLPMPKGGKHSNNPILCEDQPMPNQCPTRLARTKNNPLDNDFINIIGYSPFITRDVNSKSAILGIRSGGSFKYWMKRNPNESRKKQK